MSDLQCPARIFLLRRGAAAPAVVAGQLAAERIAAVYDEQQLGLADLPDLADRHRGEALLVVTDHPYGSALVLVELDADGQRVTPREITPG